MKELTFQQVQLDNGLTVIGELNENAKSFAAGYFVNTGARDESAAIAGVSHFLEHMMFKGTERRTAEDINREFDEMGARNNAYTSSEHTVYFGAVLPEQQPRILDLLSDMMRPTLRQDDFDIEKQVILEEIAMYEDRPSMRVFDTGNERYFNGHPMGNSVLGTPATITPLQREQMLDYFRARYAPNNLVVALSGNYDWDAAVRQLEELTAGWEPQETGREHPPATPRTGFDVIEDGKLKRVHMGLWAPGLSAQDDRRYAAALLANVLGDSSGSRLYWELVDRGLADMAELWHDPADGIGMFNGYLSAAPERAQEVLEIARGVLRDAKSNPPSEEEWERAQKKLATGVTLQSETPFSRLMSLGTAFLYNRAYQSAGDVLAKVLGARREDAIELLAQGVLDELYVLQLGPAAVPAGNGAASQVGTGAG